MFYQLIVYKEHFVNPYGTHTEEGLLWCNLCEKSGKVEASSIDDN